MNIEKFINKSIARLLKSVQTIEYPAQKAPAQKILDIKVLLEYKK